MIEAEIAAAGPSPTDYLLRLYYVLGLLHYHAGSIDDFQRVALHYEEAARQLDMPGHLQWAQWLWASFTWSATSQSWLLSAYALSLRGRNWRECRLYCYQAMLCWGCVQNQAGPMRHKKF